MIDKLKKIKVTTPKGDRSLLFIKYDLPSTGGRIPCTSKCPYAEICDYLPHPEQPDNEDVSFVDFCGAIGQDAGGDESDMDLIPVKGTIERSLKDILNPDVYQKLLKEQKLIPVDSVVDSFCPGWCDSYKKDHSGCTIDNTSCLMRELFIKENIEPSKPQEDAKESDEVEDGNKDTE